MHHEATRSISRAKNPDKLHELVRGIVGQKCWKATFSYGGELVLHFGARLPCDHPKMDDEFEGEWIFGTCGTAWELSTPTERVLSVERGEAELEKKVAVLENRKVTRFQVTGDVLAISFNNHCTLRVVPTAEDARHEVPYWELFMPKDMFVQFRPGAIWSYKRSDVPVS